MERFKSKKLLTALGTILAVIVMLFVAFWASEKIVVNKNGDSIDGMAAKINNTANGTFKLDGIDIVKQASQVLGKSYVGGKDSNQSGKGYNGNIWTGTYNKSKLYTASQIGNVSLANGQGLDCSGLVYWTLSWLDVKTTGFAKNKPVPVDTADWLSYTSPTVQVGNNASQLVNILKENDTITQTNRYYNYDNGKKLPMGTIVVAKNTSKNGACHAWITIGDLGTANAAEAIEILKGMGLPQELLTTNNVRSMNNTCTYWRIEATAGSVNQVLIDNGDPNSGDVQNGKPVGTIYAFQIANDVSGKYGLKIDKFDSKYNKMVVSNINSVFTVQHKVDGQIRENLSASSSNQSGLVFGDYVINQQNASSVESFIIKEANPPKDGYERYDKDIEIQIKKERTATGYTVSVDKVYIGGNLDQGTLVKPESTTLKSYDNDNVRIDCLNNQVIVALKNKRVDLALKKMIQTISSKQEDGIYSDYKAVIPENSFNTDRCTKWGVNTAPLNEGKTNAIYNECKYPVQVKVGDRVKYDIRIFNEGEVAAKANKITDYIPVGLRVLGVYLSSDTNMENNLIGKTSGDRAEYKEANGVLNITLDNQELINPYTPGNLSGQIIWVVCEVKEDATGILTNVAEITEYKTASGTIAKDIDSTANNWNNPNTANHADNETTDKSTDGWRNYANAQQSLTNTNGWFEYKAQDTDDDDFDKLEVLRPTKVTIKKVNNDGTPISEIPFTISKSKDNKDTTVADNEANSEFQYIDYIPSNYNGNILYSISEGENASYIQVKEDMRLMLSFNNGKLAKYSFFTGNESNMNYTDSSADYLVESTLQGAKLNVHVDFNKEDSDVCVTIKNIPQTSNQYNVNIKKVSAVDESKTLDGVVFNGTQTIAKDFKGAKKENATETPFTTSGTVNGIANIVSNQEINKDNYNVIDKYTINEINIGSSNADYTTSLESDFTLLVSKRYDVDNNKYVIDKIGLVKEGTTNSSTPRTELTISENGLNYVIKATLDANTNTVTVTVPNFPNNTLPLKIIKVNKDDESEEVVGTKFKIYNKIGDNSYRKIWDGVQNAAIELNQSIDPTETSATYKIVEVNAADGYDNVFDRKDILINVQLNAGTPTGVTFEVYNQVDNTLDTSLNDYIDVTIEDNTIKIIVKNKPTDKVVDLALKKVITEVDGVRVNSSNGYDTTDRLTEGNDKYHINTDPLDEGKNDAEYYLNKTPVTILNGSKITYELRIYNEGEVDATASEIVDYVPAPLRVLNVYYKGEKLTEGVDYTYSQTSPVLTISKLNDADLIPAYVPGNGTTKGTIKNDVVVVECEAFSSAIDRIVTNIAEITEYKTSEGIITEDRDSQPKNFINPVKEKIVDPMLVDTLFPQWEEYYQDKIVDGEFNNYPGQQDDDDFEKIIVIDVDLALKKIITKVGDTDINELDSEHKYDRFQDGKIVTDTSHFDYGPNTTAAYYLNKTPVQVNVNDYITYEIRIYNEGDVKATASIITDYIPKGLTFDSVYYGNEQLSADKYSIENNVLTINILNEKNLIDEYQYDGNIKYDSVFVKCQVTGETKGLLTNVAEISEYKTSYGYITTDRDSQTEGRGEWQAPEGSDKLTLDGKSGDEWANYYEIANYNIGEFKKYPGQQDDDDFEKIYVLPNYNLVLEKVNGKNVAHAMSSVKFKLNGTEMTTTSNGKTETTEWMPLLEENKFVIEEIETDNKYAKLKTPIYLWVEKEQYDDGSASISGCYVNTVDDKDSAAFAKYEGGTKSYIFIAKDEADRDVEVRIYIEQSTEVVGNYEIKVRVQNILKDSEYQLYINKIDAFNNNIAGVKFNVSAVLTDKSFEETYTTSNGATYITSSEINALSENSDYDYYEINEIQTLEDYVILPKALRLEVEKGLSTRGDSVEIKNMTLSYGDETSSDPQSVVLRDISVGTYGQKVDIKAELKEVTVDSGEKVKAIEITIPNKPVLQLYSLRIKKVNKITKEPLEGATFKYGLAGSEDILETEETDSTGLTYLIYDEIIETAKTTTYNITEGKIPQNYLPYNGNIKLNVVTKLENGMYVLDKQNTNVEGEDITFDIVNNVITLIVPDEPTGTYSINIKKVSKENGTPLAGAKFAIKEAQSTEKAVESDSTNESGVVNLISSAKMNSAKVDSYIITETAVPEKYRLYDGEIKLDVAVKLVNGQYVIDEENTKVNGKNVSLDINSSTITITVSDPEKEFDLSLRKFISKVNSEELTGEQSREPVVDLGTLINGDPAKNGEKTATYTPHTKEPKLVCPTDIVEYTLRVYNEGELDGYARQIIDDVPAGVQMVAPMYDEEGKPANLNAQYRWVMYREISNNDINKTEETEKVPYAVNDIIRYADKYYVPTLNADEAVLIVTDFLSKDVGEQGLEEGKLNPNLLYAFNGQTLDYADIKVEFIVRPSKDDKAIITNYAQISEDEYKDGTPVTDRDSTPNVWNEGEDDQDVEHLKVKWFDLALYKWVTTAIVTEDGQTKEYPTEHTQDYKDKLVNVTVAKEKLDKTVVKFKYIVKVENQGTLPGYAKELRDHIPAGLKFIEEDNTEYGWKLQEDGTIITDYFKDTLLNPTESVEIPVVLTWINGTNNLGLKVNYAEISKDYNEYGDTPDIDSTPDNFKDIPVEDDEDGDEVMLNIKTGEFVNGLIAIIGLYFVVTVAAGVWGVKRFVLNTK